MNLGVYVQSLAISEDIGYAIDNINQGIGNGSLDDASIFFDDVGANHLPIKCGCFNSADIWSFTGHLVVTSIEKALSVINIVNKFKLFYYYNWHDEKDVMGIISIVNHPRVSTICRTDNDAEELYRITGIKPISIVDKFNLPDMLKAIQS
jgi:hypothetical protein